jgi:tetratricopeptide (TPR) repeat protein
VTSGRWRDVWLATAASVLGGMLGGCATAWNPGVDADYSAELLSGVALFGEEVSSDELPDVDILALSEDMALFLQEEVGDSRIGNVRFRRMFNGLTKNGYFETAYRIGTTNTAAETFSDKSGNCLSYTSMFIALAREVGLNATFQIVEVPPTWDADSGFLIRYTHINVLMRGLMFNRSYGSEFSVDFNDVLPDPEYDRYEITDAEAASLFYGNRSVVLFRAGDHRPAFVLLKKALELSPDNADLWINLGAFYAKLSVHDHAIKAYQMALYADPYNQSALSGLSRTYEFVGATELANQYAMQVRRYRQNNPYYHYAIAQAEYENARYQKALVAINAALDLKFRNGRFHFLKGLTQRKLGEEQEAQASFRQATRFGNFGDLQLRYPEDVADVQPVS